MDQIGLNLIQIDQTCSYWFMLVQSDQTCSKLVQNLFKLDQTCSNWIKLVQTCSSLFKFVQTCSNLFKLDLNGPMYAVPNGSNLFKLDQIVSNASEKNCETLKVA